MKLTDEKIIEKLLTSTTNKEAAAALGISERYLYKRTAAEVFKTKLAAAKARLLESAITALRNSALEAVETLRAVLHDPNASAQTRINAAQIILSATMKYTEREDIISRLETIEALQYEH